jgi:D-glycero-beta-D-manno-heptose 1-phosphate adenylyltransferase
VTSAPEHPLDTAAGPALEKIFSRQQLVEMLRSCPRPVVFTNGVFDILHRGHVSYLAQAKALGTTLVVGLNSDHSARGLGKGPERPINNEVDRCWVVASLQSVDFVVLFDEPTPVALLAELRPDIYVKGGDYDMEQLEETRLVRSWGGTSQALNFVTGYSTTRLVERLRAPATQHRT